MMKYSKIVTDKNLSMFEGKINHMLTSNEHTGNFLSMSTHSYLKNGQEHHVAVLVFEMK